MLTKSTLLAIATTAMLAGGAAIAQDAPPGGPGMTPEQREAVRQAHREALQNMTEEERRAFFEERRAQREAKRAEMRERWENMSEEERAAFREERRAQREAKRAEMRERWENMSEEERALAREKMKKRRAMRDRSGPGGMRGHDGPGPGGANRPAPDDADTG